MSDMDIDDYVKEVEQNIEWFCDKVIEPIPHDEQSRDHIFKRMMALGWIRQAEVDTYKQIIKNDD